MSWRLLYAKRAQKSLRTFPLRDRQRLNRALDEMVDDPFRGDVAPLRNQPMEFRKRVGDYRIFFDVDRQRMLVLIHDVVRRTSKTYGRR